MTLMKRIAEMGGDEGWWKSGTQEVFENSARILIVHGFSEDEAIDFLGNIQGAMMNEYGE